jgi:hypothetical protein
MTIKKLSIHTIIEKILSRNRLLIDTIDFNDIIEWAGEAIEMIGAPMAYTQKSELILIEEGRAELPCDIYKLVTVEFATHGSPMRTSTSSKNIDKSCSSEKNLCVDDFSYQIRGNYIFPNVEKGELLITYWAMPIDEYGLPEIPDDIKFSKAITHYITDNIYHNLWAVGKISDKVYNQNQVDKDWYMGAAQTRAQEMNLDKMESVKNIVSRMMPQVNSWDTFFKNAGNPELRKKHP